MRDVPRHEFVPSNIQEVAYLDSPLPIGFEKTTSQPFIIALMTHLLDLQPNDRILEVGTGLGYQAAILARLVDTVYSVEIIEELARKLAAARYEHIRLFSPEVTEAQRAHASLPVRGLIAGYRLARRLPLTRSLLRVLGPALHAVARRGA